MKQGCSFFDMRDGEDGVLLEEDGGSTCSDDNDDDDNEETRNVGKENKNNKTADSKDIEDLANLFTNEENWGQSQSFFNPMSPSLFNKDD